MLVFRSEDSSTSPRKMMFASLSLDVKSSRRRTQRLSPTPRRELQPYSLANLLHITDLPCASCRPKIQRLVTPERLQRRRHLRSLNRRRTEVQKAQVEEYKTIVAKRQSEKKSHDAGVKAKRAAAASH